jgi:hypothetical protein
MAVMTLLEYQRKLASYMTSDAPIEEREAAIVKLRSQFEKNNSSRIAMEQILEAQADISDIGDY